jgi:hypothetical protein
MKMLRKMIIISLLVVVALLLSGCMAPGKVTGGGWVASSVDGKANFGFCAAQNSCGDTSGKFTYRDKNAGVSMSGDITFAAHAGDGTYILSGTFRSTNPKIAGSGVLSATVQDNGEPGIGGDYFAIEITQGTWVGYSNDGELGGGNIQAHPGEDSCD